MGFKWLEHRKGSLLTGPHAGNSVSKKSFWMHVHQSGALKAGLSLWTFLDIFPPVRSTRFINTENLWGQVMDPVFGGLTLGRKGPRLLPRHGPLCDAETT